MDSISKQRVYEDFEPTWDLVTAEDSDTLLVYLPGFKKEHLRVQLSRAKNLIISGECPIVDNTWSRFRKEFAVSHNCDVNGISARFDAGILYVKQPKLIMPANKQDEEKPTITEPPKPPKPVEEPQPQYNAKEQTTSSANPAEPTNVKKNDEYEAPKHVSKKGAEEEREMEKKKGKESEFEDSKTPQEQEGMYAKSDDGKNSEEENESDKCTRDGHVMNGGGCGDGDGSGKGRVEKYRLGVGVVANEAKRWRKVMNMALAALMLIVLGIYIVNVVRSPMKVEK